MHAHAETGSCRFDSPAGGRLGRAGVGLWEHFLARLEFGPAKYLHYARAQRDAEPAVSELEIAFYIILFPIVRLRMSTSTRLRHYGFLRRV
jgi:hypothetical protein